MALNFNKSNFLKFYIYLNNNNNIKNYKSSFYNNNCKQINDCNCTEIKEFRRIKYLGLIYVNKLNWKYYIDHGIDHLTTLVQDRI